LAASWQEAFFGRLVEASRQTGDARLATATLRPRKKIASYEHAQCHRVECCLGGDRINGNENSRVLVVECEPRRGTEIDESCLRRELAEAGAGGEMRVNGATLVVQYQWGYGRETPFPVHNGHQVDQATRWTVTALKTLFDHLERRHRVITASDLDQPVGAPSADFRLAIEQYLEDILVAQWASLDWGADLEYLGRQVPCGTLGRIDILARDRATGDFVVIELKRDQTDDEVIGQLSRYMGWAAEHKAAAQVVGVRGIIVVHELTPKLRAAAIAHRNVQVYRYDLTVALTRVPVRKQNADEIGEDKALR
jgi:hypothetical protein